MRVLVKKTLWVQAFLRHTHYARGILTRKKILGTFCQESGCQILIREADGVRKIAPDAVPKF